MFRIIGRALYNGARDTAHMTAMSCASAAAGSAICYGGSAVYDFADHQIRNLAERVLPATPTPDTDNTEPTPETPRP